MENQQVFYVPGQQGVVDFAVKQGDELVGLYARQNLAQLREKYPDIAVGDYATVCAEQQNALKTAPAVITRSRFIEMLGVLPPEDWQVVPGAESFKLCEYHSGNITRIFARVGTKYYEFLDDARLTHSEILAKIHSQPALAPAPGLN